MNTEKQIILCQMKSGSTSGDTNEQHHHDKYACHEKHEKPRKTRCFRGVRINLHCPYICTSGACQTMFYSSLSRIKNLYISQNQMMLSVHLKYLQYKTLINTNSTGKTDKYFIIFKFRGSYKQKKTINSKQVNKVPLS